MEIDDQKFDATKLRAEEVYKKIGTVKCPYLNEVIHFNSIGLNHLLFKAWNKPRTRVEQYTRLRLLKFAPQIIAKSHTLQDYCERKMFVRQKINSRWEQTMKLVKYYGFVAIVDSVRIKIIVKEIEGGAKFFYSLYPSWRETNENGAKRKELFAGNLETD